MIEDGIRVPPQMCLPQQLAGQVQTIRVCERCGADWKTVERKFKDDGADSQSCGKHEVPGRGGCYMSLSPTVYHRHQMKWDSLGIQRAMAIGAVWRRRQCVVCKLRWTTYELMADESVVFDVTICPYCKGESRRLFPERVPDPETGIGRWRKVKKRAKSRAAHLNPDDDIW